MFENDRFLAGFVQLEPQAMKSRENVRLCDQIFTVAEAQPRSLEVCPCARAASNDLGWFAWVGEDNGKEASVVVRASMSVSVSLVRRGLLVTDANDIVVAVDRSWSTRPTTQGITSCCPKEMPSTCHRTASKR